MSTPILPPNPSLIAILLNVRTRAGPNFVFHYPAVPTADSTSSSYRKDGSAVPDHSSRGDALSSGSSNEDEWSSADDDGIIKGGNNHTYNIARGGRLGRSKGIGSGGVNGGGDGAISSRNGHFRRMSSSRTRSRGMGKGPGAIGDGDDDDGNENIDGGGSGSGGEPHKGGGHGVNGGRRGGGVTEAERRGNMMGEGSNMEWEYLLGFPTSSLEKLLSPQRNFHKKRLEIGLEELVFLGYPIFAKEGGGWKKRRRKKKQRSDAQDLSDSIVGNEQVENDSKEAEKLDSDHVEMREEGGNEHLNAADGENHHSDDGSEARSTSTSDGDEEMTMFTVVFILDPPLLEYRVRVMDMYDNVVKKFAKALKYEQARSNYVWHQSRKILEMKEKAKENCEFSHRLMTL